MTTRFPSLRHASTLAVFIVCTTNAFAQQVTTPESDPAASLRNRHRALREELDESSMQRGIYLESVERARTSQGDVYALVDHPYDAVSEAFLNPENWCEMLILHLNVKYCQTALRDHQPVLLVALGKKSDQALSDTYRVEFAYDVTASASDYMQVHLDAKQGPFGTKNHRIALEIVAIEKSQAFVHIQFSYTNGILSSLATNVYLATAGKDKVGFTRVDPGSRGGAIYIRGLRGVVERNTMRYYLAIDAYLSALPMPLADRFEARAARWFDATERYARQLHEVDREAYLTMKRSEYLRQQTSQWTAINIECGAFERAL